MVVHNIQVLRALAALLVVVYHLAAPLQGYLGESVSFSFLASGVDIFFVISGFIMVYTSAGAARGPVSFWRDRFIRVAPLYWLATGAAIALFALGFQPAGLHGFDAKDLLQSLFFLPVLDRADGWNEPIVTVGWTLIFEMYFYLLFGLTLLVRNALAGVVLMAGVFAGLLLIETQAGPLPPMLAYYACALPFEFLAGSLMAIWYVGKNRWTPPTWVGWLLMASGLCILPFLGDLIGASGEDMNERVIAFGVPATLIVLGAVVLEARGLALRSPFLLLLGGASYALYLFHIMVLQAAVKASAMVAARLGIEPSPVLAFVVGGGAVVASVGVAVAVHVWVEKPLTRFLRAKLANIGLPAADRVRTFAR